VHRSYAQVAEPSQAEAATEPAAVEAKSAQPAAKSSAAVEVRLGLCVLQRPERRATSECEF
jgi:hypothetical protein